MRIDPEPVSNAEATRGETLGWSIAGSAVLLVVAFFVGQTGMIITGFSCWNDLGNVDEGCRLDGFVMGLSIIFIAAVIVVVAIVLMVRASRRFRRAKDVLPRDIVEGER